MRVDHDNRDAPQAADAERGAECTARLELLELLGDQVEEVVRDPAVDEVQVGPFAALAEAPQVTVAPRARIVSPGLVASPEARVGPGRKTVTTAATVVAQRDRGKDDWDRRGCGGRVRPREGAQI